MTEDFVSKFENFSNEEKLQAICWLMQNDGGCGSKLGIMREVMDEFPDEDAHFWTREARKRADITILSYLKRIDDFELIQNKTFSFMGTYQMPALFWAIRHSHFNCIDYLLDIVDINAVFNNETALNKAINNDCWKILRKMIDAGTICVKDKSPARVILTKRNRYHTEELISVLTLDEINIGIKEIINSQSAEWYKSRKHFCDYGYICEMVSNISRIKNIELKNQINDIVVKECPEEIRECVIKFIR